MQKIRITKAPETIDGEAVVHWQTVVGCIVEADGQSILQIRQANPDLPPPKAGHYEVSVGELIEALPPANLSALKYWGESINNHTYLVSIPHDCAKVVPETEQQTT